MPYELTVIIMFFPILFKRGFQNVKLFYHVSLAAPPGIVL